MTYVTELGWPPLLKSRVPAVTGPGDHGASVGLLLMPLAGWAMRPDLLLGMVRVTDGGLAAFQLTEEQTGPGAYSDRGDCLQLRLLPVSVFLEMARGESRWEKMSVDEQALAETRIKVEAACEDMRAGFRRCVTARLDCTIYTEDEQPEGLTLRSEAWEHSGGKRACVWAGVGMHWCGSGVEMASDDFNRSAWSCGTPDWPWTMPALGRWGRIQADSSLPPGMVRLFGERYNKGQLVFPSTLGIMHDKGDMSGRFGSLHGLSRFALRGTGWPVAGSFLADVTIMLANEILGELVSTRRLLAARTGKKLCLLSEYGNGGVRVNLLKQHGSRQVRHVFEQGSLLDWREPVDEEYGPVIPVPGVTMEEIETKTNVAALAAALT